MKKNLIIIFAVIALQIFTVKSQTISTFDDLFLIDTASYWNGASEPMGTTFSSGNAVFPNFYDSSFGGFWASGWAYSNMKDSITAGFSNQFSAITAIGSNNSEQYAVGQQGAIINLNSNATGKAVNGFYVTNSAYAAISMRDGDGFAKKFGGTSGNDPDWFKLTIRKWHIGNLTNDSVEFYLADYRFSDNAQDYIVKNWQWIDLTSLGNTDSLQFNLSSSDAGTFGMNTPAFFCVDDFTTSDNFLFTENNFEKNSDIKIFPNPNNGNFNVQMSQFENVQINIFNFLGEKVYSNLRANNNEQLSTNLSSGIYFIKIYSNDSIITKKLILE